MGSSVGIVVHRTSREAAQFAQQVIAWLQERGISVCLDSESALRMGQSVAGCRISDLKQVRFIITLGGDGTILAAARMAAPIGIPILGAHMGQFGFIAEAHPSDLFQTLETILDGQMEIEERMMVRAEVWRGGQRVHSGVGLNEALVKSGMSHLLRLKTSLRGAPFATYPADGLIVSTPTGSTAYSLSAGGPLVEPTVQALVMVPICPHTLSARPMVLPCDEVIEIEIELNGGEVIFAVDGVDPFFLESGDRVIVQRADYATRLIVLGHATFYRKVRNRYLYGERLNE
ncbi:MAG TPA: NAD(+)/NADH kinase [Chthonomonadaceae bacterium]|nr:NAD(+)/NADH kinase [Chthonomonadaceae bacterium]